MILVQLRMGARQAKKAPLVLILNPSGKRHSRPEKRLLGGEMVEGGALVDKKRLRPAQPSQKVALVKSDAELLRNVTERKKETSVS